MNTRVAIRQDWSANAQNTKGRLITVLFRLASYAAASPFRRVVLAPFLVLYRFFVEWVLGIELPCTTAVGEGLCIYHGQALVVHKETRIGRYCTLRQSTTIGNNGQRTGCPTIGDHVTIGANVCIIGPVTVGDHVTIGAGSVVTKSIPAYATVVGNPARIIRYAYPEAVPADSIMVSALVS